MKYRRILGIIYRNIFLLKRSIHRLLGIFYWVTIELFLWGFITFWLEDITAAGNPGIDFVVTLIGALIFWDLFTRSQQLVTVSFLEDVWTRNLINIFTSPLSPKEYMTGLVFLSAAQGLITFVYMITLAWALYAFNIWSLGFAFIPFILNIFIFGWTLGFVTVGLIIRFGPVVDIIAWTFPALFMPLSAVFYPLSVVPEYLHTIAFFIPTLHVFEGMRALILGQPLPLEGVAVAFTLNIIYFLLSIAFFYWMLRIARRRGIIGRLLTE